MLTSNVAFKQVFVQFKSSAFHLLRILIFSLQHIFRSSSQINYIRFHDSAVFDKLILINQQAIYRLLAPFNINDSFKPIVIFKSVFINT